MCFTTTAETSQGVLLDTFNIDFPVGPGARGGNLTPDIMLVQALFHILYFEHRVPSLPPPPGHTSIEIDGKLGPATARFITHFQQQSRAAGMDVRLDGIFDPFRRQGQVSTISKTRYALEFLNINCSGHERRRGTTNYRDLPRRDDMPPNLTTMLSSNVRPTALKYMLEEAVA